MTAPDTTAIRAKAKMWHLPPGIADNILALCEEVDRLNAAIVRQAGAAKTLRESTLAEVQHLKDMDRSEYHAAASLDSERLANGILTDENDKLRAENQLLRASVAEAMKDLHDIINCGNCSGSRQSARLALRALAAMETSHE